MGQKDLTQKDLECYTDVFADVINALMYDGEKVLQAENLQSAPTETLYHSAKAGVRNQFHDVSKYEIQNGKVKLQYTLENETDCDYKMILRKAGYEGAVYREQYDNKVQDTYPIIGAVLYWGHKKWNALGSIHAFFKKRNLPKQVFRYIDNVSLQVYHMCYLPPEVRQRFHSDMRVVVDYLAEGKDYVPTNQKLKHPEALLQMLQNLTGDKRYLQILCHMRENEKKEGGVTMCELLDRYWNDGEKKGMQKGMQCVNELIQRLIRDGRGAEIERMASDRAFQTSLLKEYGLG